MLRALVLAALAAVAALFAAALLRAESRAAAPSDAAPAAEVSCTARTRSGAPCSRAAEPGSDRCWQHR